MVGMKARKPLKRKTPLKSRQKPRRAASASTTPTKTPPKGQSARKTPSRGQKRPKKTRVQVLEKELDALMGKFIRGDGRCFLTGKVDFTPKGVVQNCHLERRSRSKAIKFSPLNGVPGDMSGHVKLDNTQLGWGNLLSVHIPGRLERLCRMKDWALANKGLFRLEDILEKYRTFYKSMAEQGITWWEWHNSKGMQAAYKDPLEEVMEELGE